MQCAVRNSDENLNFSCLHFQVISSYDDSHWTQNSPNREWSNPARRMFSKFCQGPCAIGFLTTVHETIGTGNRQHLSGTEEKI